MGMRTKVEMVAIVAVFFLVKVWFCLGGLFWWCDC